MLLLILLLTLIANSESCSRKITDNGFVCVCNSTYCDQAEKLGRLSDGSLKVYYTSRENPGFNVKTGHFSSARDHSATLLQVNNKKTYQKILGFGGAFTDATGINIGRLPVEAQSKLLESYFGQTGIEYSLCRVPIGGTDFSTRPYSYDDFDGDTELAYFKLQPEDLEYKIPYIQQAQSLRGNKTFKLVSSCWTAPVWMKNQKVWQGFSMLRKENYQIFADYMVRFLDEYRKHGINFWGLTTGNEPLNGFYLTTQTKVNSMGWEPNNQAKWIRRNLGPSLKNSFYRDVKVMIHDEGLITLPYVVPPMFDDDQTLKYIDGVATHWYHDGEVDPQVRNLAKTYKKDTFLLSTESCYFQTEPLLGSWERAAGYIGSIIDHITYGFGGWIDWNMVLNLTGGPTYIDFLADSPVIIGEDSKQFYKQPMFYGMGHFSKFVVPDSVLVNVTIEADVTDVKVVAFLRPDKLKAIVVFNNATSSISMQIEDNKRYSQVLSIPAKSINTILYPNK